MGTGTVCGCGRYVDVDGMWMWMGTGCGWDGTLQDALLFIQRNTHVDEQYRMLETWKHRA